MSDIVMQFVDGKVQHRLRELSLAMEEFFKENQPIIEDVYIATKVLQKKTFFNLKEEDVELSWRKDYEGALKGLTTYNRIFSRVDTALALMSSNFKLRSFLAENGIAFNTITDVQADLNEYWESTYGELIRRWGKIKEKLAKLRDVLAREVKMLGEIPHHQLFLALKEYPPLIDLFMVERDLFYEIMQDYTRIRHDLIGPVVAGFETAVRKARGELVALRNCLDKQLDEHLKQARGKAAKSIVVMIYFAGILNALKDLRWRLPVKGIMSVFTKIVRGSEEKAEARAEALLSRKEDAEKILADTMDSAADMIVSVNSIIRALA